MLGIVLGGILLAAGCGVGPRFKLVSPIDDAVASSTPSLSWTEPDGSDSDEPWMYEVSVSDESGRLVFFRTTMDSSVAAGNFLPGRYTWSVTAVSDDDRWLSAENAPESFVVP